MFRPIALTFALASAVSALQPQTTPQPAAAPPAAPPQPGQPGPPSAPQVRFEDLPPAIRLGIRAEAARRSTPVVPAVVLVSDPASYAEAISRWTPRARYPVLYDDGTALSREDIARFVRAFGATRVVRYSARDEARLREARPDAPPAAAEWPATEAGRQTAITTAMLRAWGAANPAEFGAKLNEFQVTPPGVVIASADDPAWTAALALAAARAQPIFWLDLAGGMADESPAPEAEAFSNVIETSCETVGLPWRDLGDAIDAVTICLDAPARVRPAPDRVVALTDWVGRRPATDGESRETGARWAWAGQVHGSEAQASYRAMCGLFLTARRAWLFDGYPSSQPWNTFDVGPAREALERVGFETVADDALGGAGGIAWLRRSSRSVDAHLILVNTKGGPEFFEFDAGGVCRPGDLPVLGLPAAVHFVHSWSAANPADRDTLAGRWLERGVFAYAGSIQEPYLQAFVPTPVLGARASSTFPWGAAPRLDDGRAWRIAVFGDPLFTVGPAAPRSEAELPFEGLTDVAALIPDAVREKRYAEALHLLALAGRDGDAARLAAGLLRQDRAAVTPEVARAAIPPLFRENRLDELLMAWENARGLTGGGPELEPWLRDFVWLALSSRVEASAAAPDENHVNLLRTDLRAGQPGADAATIAPAIARLYGRDVALGMLREARDRSTLPADITAADGAINRLMSSGR